jgi:integrase
MRERGSGGLVQIPGSRFWYTLIRVDGKQVRESTKTDSKMAAEKILQTRLGLAGLGVDLVKEKDVKEVRYETIRDEWLAGGKNGYGAIKHLDEFFANKRVVEIRAAVLLAYIAHRRKGGAADETIRRSLNDLRAMMRQAWEHEVLRVTDIPKFPMKVLKPGKVRKGFIEPADFYRLRDEFPASLKPIVTFLYFTGCRIGAARKITWAMVAKDCSEIELPGEITKSGEPLTLPLSGDGLKDLAAMLRKTFRKDGQLFDDTNFRMEWNMACVRAKLGTYDKATRKRTGIMPHDFRRSALRNLLRAGVSRTVAMEISGHKTEHVFNRYNITDTSDVRAALEKVGKYATKR